MSCSSRNTRTPSSSALIRGSCPGGDDLIAEFFSELLGTINADPTLKERLSHLISPLASYGAMVAKSVDAFVPGAGTVTSTGLKMAERILERDQGLHSQRERLLEQLEKLDVPVVILIDELDRVDDREIRLVAQLVRSVVDFPNVSYVLAYDEIRVIEALGGGRKPGEIDRGRSYLEKIVQLQIPLPIAFDDEIRALFLSELRQLAPLLGLPENWECENGFQALLDILVPGVIRTPRDVKRVVGPFHVLEGMVRGEVDWIDLLGYAALIAKAPTFVKDLKHEPDLFVDSPTTHAAAVAQSSWEEMDVVEKLEKISPKSERGRELEELYGFLFPILSSDRGERGTRAADAIFHHDVLLTVLRLGLVPGRYSRREIEDFFESNRSEMEEFLGDVIRAKSVDAFAGRLGDVVSDIPADDHTSFWLAVCKVLEKPDARWLDEYSPMHANCREFADLFEHFVSQETYSHEDARTLFRSMTNAGDISVTSLLLRTNIFQHGLFDLKQIERKGAFLDRADTERFALARSDEHKSGHLHGDWLARQWHLNPVYTMLGTGLWDSQCRDKLLSLMEEDDAALIGVTVLLYGSVLTAALDQVEALVDREKYCDRIRSYRESVGEENLTDFVRNALNRALSGDSPRGG